MNTYSDAPPDFDHPPQRMPGDSLKWNRYRDRDVIPLWVADMDFAAPPPVLAALHGRVDHGVFGYGEPEASVVDAVQAHLQTQYDWSVDPDWLVWLPGLVTGINVACRAVGEPADAIFTATPIYPPFLSAPRLSGRRTVTAPLVREGGAWQWDFAAVDGVLRDSRARMLLLCHPHNPVGRAWRHDELAQMLALAEKHDLTVCSDEIHCDLVLDRTRRHIPFAKLDEQAAKRSITLMAPSKTFNVPGLGCAFGIIPDPGLRRRFKGVMQGIVPHVNVFGFAACEAAFRDGEPWRQALLGYLRGNAARVMEAVNATGVLSMTQVEATYLAWIDCRTLGLDRPAPFFEAAGLGLSDGAEFGAPGFVRLNFGCSRSLLDQALSRLADAVSKR